jgi:hypothetical protein
MLQILSQDINVSKTRKLTLEHTERATKKRQSRHWHHWTQDIEQRQTYQRKINKNKEKREQHRKT